MGTDPVTFQGCTTATDFCTTDVDTRTVTLSLDEVPCRATRDGAHGDPCLCDGLIRGIGPPHDWLY